MFELNKILSFGKTKLLLNQQLVLATIVRTEGSTYRKRGTQMMVAEDLTFEGAISGGCVESEVVRQSTSIFNGGPDLTFEYDGRYKLGCNGKLYILLEKVDMKKFEEVVEITSDFESKRRSFHLGIGSTGKEYGSYYSFGDTIKNLGIKPINSVNFIEQVEIKIEPQNQLVIIGSEYDAILLARLANQTGLKTFLIGKHLQPGDNNFTILNIEPEELEGKIKIDINTALVIMTHSYSRDLNFLKQLIGQDVGYLGILGPADRRDKLMNDLLELQGIDLLNMPENIFAPIGLDIGAELPEEISVAIISEIISVFRKGHGAHLKDRLGSIHMQND